MTKLDASKLEQLVSQEKWDEVKTLLTDYFRSDLSEEEKGQIYTTLALSQIAAQNSLNQQKLEILSGLMGQIKQLQQEQKQLEDQVDLTLSRNQLKKD